MNVVHTACCRPQRWQACIALGAAWLCVHPHAPARRQTGDRRVLRRGAPMHAAPSRLRHDPPAGQAVVQYVRGTSDRRHYAVKFFLDPDAFFVEAALYAACFPEIQKSVSPEVAARAVDVAAASGGEGIGAIAIPAAAARFLPQVEAVCDGAAGNLIDAAGRQLPPCIVMEKGESLQDWSNRAEPDFFTVLAVRSRLKQTTVAYHCFCAQLASLHDMTAGGRSSPQSRSSSQVALRR